MCSRKWLILALVVCGLASACQDYNTNLSVQTAASTLIFVSPASATAGAQSFTISASGVGFSSGALILWNGTALTTTFVSSNTLTAVVPASDLTTAGTVQIAVEIPGSAQSPTQNINSTVTTEISNKVPFTINPVSATPPAITSLSASTTSQASTPYCSALGFTLTVNGSNFTSDAVVNWNGSPRTTTFGSATQLTASILATDSAFPGKAVVTVTNSAGSSNASSFTLSTPSAALPAPTITSLSQTTAPAGSPALTITVLGTVLPCTTVQWVNSNSVTSSLATTYSAPVGGTPSLTAVIPATDLGGAGTVQTAHVQLFNPSPGGGISTTSASFTINPPAILSLSASTTSSNTTPSCNSADVALAVTGTNFVNGSVVNWVAPPAVSLALASNFVSSTQLTATIPASLIVSQSAVNLQVSNFGALSNQSPFTVSASSPAVAAISSVSPATGTAGSSGVTLTITGTNLLPCSGVQWTNGGGTTQLATAFIAATQLSPAQLAATVPAAELASVGTAQVAVSNPALSSNTSNSLPFNVVLPTLTSLSASTTSANNTPFCSPAGLTLTVNGTGFAPGLVVNWNGSPRPTTLVSSTQLSAAITPEDTAFLATGSAEVAITVSGGPGTNSNSLKLSVTQLAATSPLPSPVLSSITPTNAAAEALTGPPVALTLIGTGLSPCSIVQWNGTPLPATLFVGSGGITSVVPASNITTVAADQVTVFTPSLPSSECTPSPTVNCGGGTSNPEPFAVFSPGSPVSTSLSGSALSLPLMSASGRYGVFVLASTDGVTEVPGSTQNVFFSDTCTGVSSGCTPSTTIVSAGSSSTPANGDSTLPSISSNSGNASLDGRYVAFLSSATNLISGGTNNVISAFVRDTCAGASGCTPSTQLVSVSTGGTQANGPTTSAVVSPDGRYVIFQSSATNLGGISSSGGFFLRDTCAGTSGCTPSTQPLD